MRSSRGEQGVTTLEMALLAPALLLAVFLCLQVALWYDASGVARTAATQAAINGAQAPQSVTASATAAADAVLGGPGAGIMRQGSLTVTSQGGDVVVSVVGTAPSLIAGLSWTVHATARQPLEQFQADPGS